MKDSEKIQFLISRLVTDRRVGLKDVIIQSRVNNLSYDQTVENLIRINAEMSESNQTVKMAPVLPPTFNKTKANNNETQIKYCYNFNESEECRFGASCIYSHAKDPNHTTREPRAKSTHEAKSHPPNQVGRDHRSPNGGEKFKGGCKGRSPKVKSNKASSLDDSASLKTMIISNENILDQSTSSLHHGITSIKNRSPLANKLLYNLSMKMIRSNTLIQSELQSDFSDDQSDPEVPVARSADFANRYQTIKAIQELQLQHSRRMKGLPLQNLEDVHNLETLHQMSFYHRTFLHLKYPCNVEYEAQTDQGGLISYFTGFKWNPRCSRSDDIIEEVRNPIE